MITVKKLRDEREDVNIFEVHPSYYQVIFFQLDTWAALEDNIKAGLKIINNKCFHLVLKSALSDPITSR